MIKIHIAFPYFILHNLSGYDADFIKNIKDAYKERTELPIIKEKYISFTKYIDTKKKTCIKLRIIDSFKFLTNLEKLVSYFDKDKLKITSSEFFNLSAENFDFDLTRKVIFHRSTASKSEGYIFTSTRIVLSFVNGRYCI